jgi:hypothetical protein
VRKDPGRRKRPHYRVDRSGFVLSNAGGEWRRLGGTRTRLFLGIMALIREVHIEVEAGRAPAHLKAIAAITVGSLLRTLADEVDSVQRITMASLFETLQVLLASLGDPEGKTEWKRAA